MYVAAVALVLISAAPLVGRGRGNRGRWATRAGAYVALAGVALVIVGLVFSSRGTSIRLTLPENGPPARAAGWEFTYAGRQGAGANRDLIKIIAERGGSRFVALLAVESTERDAAGSRWINRTIAGDLHILLVETKSVILMPTASVTHEGWTALPARIPGTRSTVSLLGTQVTQDLAKLQYTSESGKTVVFEVTKGRPALMDGYAFALRRLTVTSSPDMSSVIAGVDLVVTGRGLREKVVVEVSTKPLTWMPWLGTALILAGGAIALVRRRLGRGL